MIPGSSWSFRGTNLNTLTSAKIDVTDVTGQFGLPPLRGENFLTMGRTGQLFVPKIHDSRRISLLIEVADLPAGHAQTAFDALAKLFANRTQGALVYTDASAATRTGQAECVSWLPGDPDKYGLMWSGVVDFLLADPWMYGVTVTETVTPTDTATAGTPVTSDPPATSRANFTLAMTGVTSGQPIVVGAWGWEDVSTVADSFATPYTWAKLEALGPWGAADYMSLWLGTAGVGTSGTITVTLASSGHCGGWAFPLAGAGAVDVHGQTNGVGHVVYSLTPTVGPGEVLVFFGVDDNTGAPNLYSWPNLPPAERGVVASTWDTVSKLYTPSTAPWPMGVAAARTSTTLTASTGAWSDRGNWIDHLGILGVAVRSAGAPASLNITNTGTALAERAVLDFLGPITNPIALNTTTGTEVRFLGSVAAGQHLIIDAGGYTVTNNGANVLTTFTHSGAGPFFTLAPGANAVQVFGSGCSGSTLLTVSFDPAFA